MTFAFVLATFLMAAFAQNLPSENPPPQSARVATQVFIISQNQLAYNSSNPYGQVFNFQLCDTMMYRDSTFYIKVDVEFACQPKDVRVIVFAAAVDQGGASWILDNGNNCRTCNPYDKSAPYRLSTTNYLQPHVVNGQVFGEGIFVYVGALMGRILPTIRISIYPAGLVPSASIPHVGGSVPVTHPAQRAAFYMALAPANSFPVSWNVRQHVLVEPATTLKSPFTNIDSIENPVLAPYRVALPVCPPVGQRSWVTKIVAQGLSGRDFIDLFVCTNVTGSVASPGGYGCYNATSVAHTTTGNVIAEVAVYNQTMIYVSVVSSAALILPVTTPSTTSSISSTPTRTPTPTAGVSATPSPSSGVTLPVASYSAATIPQNITTTAFLLTAIAMPGTGTDLDWDRSLFNETNSGWATWGYDDGSGFGSADY